MQIIAERYEVHEMIGRGGMGTVYKGYDAIARQTVAIKSLDSLVVARDPGLLERFRREGEILSELKHPNIVRAIAAIEENDEHYLVMEFVSGGSLHDLLEREGRLSVRRVVEIALDLADALTRAHRLKIIHRDLKPANVLVASDGTPRLTDFGIARLTDGTRLTETGSLMGTYAYLSPEACQGQSLDARADIWAFGVMLYELLTGRMPFEADSAAAILIAILQNDPPDIRSLNPDVSDPLATLIHTMLIKDKDERISSARRVGAELEAILATLDGADYTPSSTPLPSRFGKTPTDSELTTSLSSSKSSEPVLTIPQIQVYVPSFGIKHIIGIGLLMLIAVGIVGVWLSRPTEKKDQPPPASAIPVVMPATDTENYAILVANLEAIETEERDITRFIIDDLEQKFLREIPFANIKIYAYPHIIHSRQEALAVAEANRASIIVWGNYTADTIELEIQLGSLANYPSIQIDRAFLEEVANVRVRLQDPRRETIAPMINGLINAIQIGEGNSYELLRTLAVVSEVRGTPAEIRGENIAAYVHRFLMEYISDTPRGLQTIRTAQRLNPGNPLLYLYSASAHIRLGNLTQARQDIETAQRLDTNNQLTVTLYTLASIKLYEGDFQGTIAYYNEIIARRPDDWFPYNFRGAMYYLLGDYDQAEADYVEAFAREPNANFPYPIAVVIALRKGDPNRARDLIQESLRKFPDPSLGNRTIQAFYGDTFPIPFGPIFSAFGNIALGRYEDILIDTQAGIAIDPDNLELLMFEGLAYCNLGQYEAALEDYNRAIELDPSFAFLYLLRASLHSKLGNMAAAMNDVNYVLQSEMGETMRELMTDGLAEEVDCTSYFQGVQR